MAQCSKENQTVGLENITSTKTFNIIYIYISNVSMHGVLPACIFDR